MRPPMRVGEYSTETQKLFHHGSTLIIVSCIPALIAAAIVLSLDDFSRVL